MESEKSHFDYFIAWDDIKHVFGLEGQTLVPSPHLAKSSLELLKSEKICGGILEYLQAEVEQRLRVSIVPAFWEYFSQSNSHNLSDTEKADIFQKAVTDLYVRVTDLSEFLKRMDNLAKDTGTVVSCYGETSYENLFKLFLRGTLHSQLPIHFEEPIRAFYARALQVFHARKSVLKTESGDESMDDDNDEDEETPLECRGCHQENEHCECNSIISIFHDTNQKLLKMDLLERLTSNVVTQIVHNHIKKHVQDTCQGSFTVSHMDSLETWLDVVVMGWIRLLYSASSQGLVTDPDTLRLLKSFRQQLCHYLFEVYTKARIEQLFNIMIEFPDSQPALEDLKECLAKTDLRSHFVVSLKNILRQKLLHLGVNTTDILTAYITAIRALRILDPSGVLLELVCEPVRKYLRTRDDTVRCIVQSLIDDSSSELAEELLKSEGLCLDEALLSEFGDVDLDASELADTWQDWQPDPVDADPSRSALGLRRRSSDIISMLVNIYGSKELFVNEYRSMLSNRLLSQFTYNTEREIRNLELLKLRFGESSLQQCEVMLKDISDSKRINNAITGDEEQNKEQKGMLSGQPFPVNAVILSAQFWPQFKEQENLQLPKEVTESLESYAKAFETMKKIRTLVWKSHLGFANIDLEIGDKKLNLTVSPVHAAIIYQFQEKNEWTATDLSSVLKIPVSTLQRKIAFWQTQGLIKETGSDKYTLVEEGPMRRMSGHGGVSAEDDESESLVRTSSDQRAEELQVFWSYIVNMLINLESLPLDRIFQMLKMFAMQGPSAVECDINQLRAFLDDKVRQHELLFSGGKYKLPKN